MGKTDSGIKEIPVEKIRDSLIALAYIEPAKDPVQTRESSIALSYTEPPKDPANGCFQGNQEDQYVETLNNDEAEKYRSQLINLCYISPPEAQGR